MGKSTINGHFPLLCEFTRGYRVSTCFNHPIDDVHVCSSANQVLKVYDIWDVRNICGDQLSMTLNRMVCPRMVGCPCRWLKHQSLQVWRSVSGQQMTPTRRYLGPVCKNGVVWSILKKIQRSPTFGVCQYTTQYTFCFIRLGALNFLGCYMIFSRRRKPALITRKTKKRAMDVPFFLQKHR